MTFQDSIKTCFSKYADFSGRATRSEYWWFILFLFIAGGICSVISPILSGVFSLATLLPLLSAASRRLHDTNRTGWWQLIALIPLIGFFVLLFFLVQDSRPADGTE